MVVSVAENSRKTPSTWNDLTLSELLRIFELVNSPVAKRLPAEKIEETLRIQAMRILLNLDDQLFDNWRESRMEEAEDPDDGETIFWAELKTVCDHVTNFMFVPLEEGKEVTESLQIAATLTRNPYPKIMYRQGGKRRRLYGPADGLANLNIAELAEALDIYDEYLEDGDEELLDRILALLWRPAKPKSKANKRSNYGGDRRLPFLRHESTVDLRMPLVKKMPPLAKALLIFWFGCCRRVILQQYANIFAHKKHVESANQFGWGGVLLGLAQGVVHLDSVAAQPWQTVLSYIAYLEDQALELEKQHALAQAS